MAQVGDEGSASCPNFFTPKKRASGTHQIGGWVGPGAGLNVIAKKRNPCPFQESNPGHPPHSLVIRLTDL
jgi:hypothetical protein